VVVTFDVVAVPVGVPVFVNVVTKATDPPSGLFAVAGTKEQFEGGSVIVTWHVAMQEFPFWSIVSID